jgi:peptide deformylase
MAILPILQYPDARLQIVAQPVTAINAEIRRLIDDMAETMYAAPGIGLAATQVNAHKRIVIIDISDTHDQLQVFVNPEIVYRDDTTWEVEEGCLSVPGIFDKVTRSHRVKVRALDAHGKEFELEAEGMLGACIQHEIDHLNGTVFVQHLSRLKRERILTKLKKQQKQVM